MLYPIELWVRQLADNGLEQFWDEVNYFKPPEKTGQARTLVHISRSSPRAQRIHLDEGANRSSVKRSG